MQTIYSLLAMQVDAEQNPAAAGVLRDTAARVQGMMALYDILHSPDSGQTDNIAAFLGPLMERMLAIYPPTPRILTDIRLGAFPIGASLLSPLGIIVNELVTNSMKHAFKGRDSGTIRLSASREEGRATLVYGDDGPGLPPGLSFENSSGLGMRLIQALALQIRGSIRIERDGGTTFVLDFPA